MCRDFMEKLEQISQKLKGAKNRMTGKQTTITFNNSQRTKEKNRAIYTVACKSLGTPCRICENVNNFNKIREIIQNACYFLFSTVLSKTFYIKYVYI